MAPAKALAIRTGSIARDTALFMRTASKPHSITWQACDGSPITVYEKDCKTPSSTMLPTVIGGFFPDKGIKPVAAQVEKAVVAIIDESASEPDRSGA
jgi:hypothetical protein